MGELDTVYVCLLDEGVNVWRPVAAQQVGSNLFRLLGPVPSSESWQFQPGEIVQCEVRSLSEGQALVAVKNCSIT